MPTLQNIAEMEGIALVPVGSHVVIIDEADYDLVSGRDWFISRGYACFMQDGRSVSMSSLIAGKKPGQLGDHINRNRLDNRRANLRHVTPSVNNQNCWRDRGTMPKGVDKNNDRFRARIKYRGKQIMLGVFNDTVSAARAYDEAAKQLYGADAMTNERARDNMLI